MNELSITSKIIQKVDYNSHFSYPSPETGILHQGSVVLPALTAAHGVTQRLHVLSRHS